ncbi:MAG: phospholipase D-like domain-containing protein [Acidobacteria bacterium]|nr:phospholipase D-like domain-containing protein [Acidobacteriota bacterium]
MRKREKKGPLSVHAIAGSYVVLLGIDMNKASSKGILGFAIERIDHSNKGKRDWLAGFKTFPGAKVPKGGLVSTKDHPLQTFFWADFTTRLAHQYTYRVVAMRGTPKKLEQAEDVEVKIDMEDEDKDKHAVYFNRGVAGSQAYARKFGNKRPTQVADNEAWIWLSRGLEEGMLAFIRQAKDDRYSLRAAVYEFQHQPALEEFKTASQNGADVKIVFDARQSASKKSPNAENRKAIDEAGIEAITIPREANSSYISHNKFIVLLRDDKPIQVWTGSTNITQGGIFGHSNVGHIVRDSKVAASYLEYWKQLSDDAAAKELRLWNENATPVPETIPSPHSTTTIFSPRPTLEALEWYTERMDKASSAVFFTAAFGVNDLFAEVLAKHKDYLRYVLLESEGKDMESLRREAANRVAVGNVLGSGAFDRWLKEKTTGLNTHVKYIHTKYMLIDPLDDDPLVITGSANFSNASTKNNDENMLVIRGDKRVADIYLGEFMRLFNHFYFRYIAKRGDEPDSETGKKRFLATDGSWLEPYYQKGTTKRMERLYFA